MRIVKSSSTQNDEGPKEFNRSIIDSSPDCIKVLDLDGNLLSMHNGEALLGIEDIRPFLNKSWIEFWTGGDRLAASAAVEAAVAGREGRFVGFFLTLRGEPKWWDVVISPMLDTHGKLSRLLAVSRDVTVRHRAETNLDFLVSVSQDLAKYTDLAETMVTVSAKIGAHFGLSLCAFAHIDEAADTAVICHEWHRDEVSSLIETHRLADFVGAEFIRMAGTGEIIVVCDTATDSRTDPATFAAVKIASFVWVPLIQDGQLRFGLCLHHSAPYTWREDEIELAHELTARIGTVLERLRGEEALRISEQRFRALFQLGPLALYFCDSNGTIEEYNDVAAKLWGRTPRRGDTDEKFCGSFKLYFVDGTSMLHAQTPVAAVLKGEIPSARDVELVMERLDGSRITIVANIVPIKDTRGKISGAINCFYDNTERSRLEQKTREQAAILIDLDRRKDEFLAMLSHELRNPLAPISNAVKILELQKNENPMQRQARTLIERQVGNLKHLIDDLLDVSRISTGRVELRRERIAVNVVVDRALETARPLIAQRRHELALSVPPQPLWLHADAARLEQVLVNLLTNAAKYTDEGGRIGLSVEQDGDTVVLRVQDSGIGIAADLLPRIFDMFSQAERSLDRAQGGLGIGLCLVQRLVFLHGGSVEARSVLGHGSDFVVRLPLMLVSMAPLPVPVPLWSAETASPFGASRRVLVVDDNVDAAQSLTMLLRALGHDVRMAYDGPGGVQAALDFRPDVMVIDIGLPIFSGLEVAKQIRKFAAFEGTVLVALTGYGQATDRAHSQEAGFDHHLTKPADLNQLQKILAEVGPNVNVAHG